MSKIYKQSVINTHSKNAEITLLWDGGEGVLAWFVSLSQGLAGSSLVDATKIQRNSGKVEAGGSFLALHGLALFCGFREKTFVITGDRGTCHLRPPSQDVLWVPKSFPCPQARNKLPSQVPLPQRGYYRQ